MSNDISCFHCGEPVPKHIELKVSVFNKAQSMCCLGCAAIAQTIVDNDLLSYYQYRTEPATKLSLVPDELKDLKQYDEQAIQEEFVTFDEQMAKVTLSVNGISCAACAWLIEKHIAALDGVSAIGVNTTTQRALLSWLPDRIALSSILTRIRALGYEALPFEINQQEQAYQSLQQRYLYRLGIAGLASMQVMMIAVALYFDFFGELPAQFKAYFRWVSLIFATPVVLYSALPFYLSAYRALKSFSLNMDVPVSIALIFAYCASLIATLTESGEVYFESISMFTFFLLTGRYLELRAKQAATTASSNLLKLIPKVARKTTGEVISVAKLAIGDHLLVLPGEHLPADGVVLSPQCCVDESMLTGESMPVVKKSAEPVYAGTLNGDNAFQLKVSKLNKGSRIAHIIQLQDKAQLAKPKIAQQADIVARYFVFALLLIAAMTWGGWLFIDPSKAFWVMLSVLVATCPCALSLATPTALTCASSRFGRLGLLLKNSDAFETLSQINHLILDKTGTLTQGKIVINQVQCHGPYSDQECLAIAAHLESHANHPLAKAFAPYLKEQIKVDDICHHVGFGLSGYYQQQPVKIGSARYVLEQEEADEHCLYLSMNGELIACFYYDDPIRGDAQAFIERAKRCGLKLTLLTGDSHQTAIKVAKRVGIEQVIAKATPEDKLAYLNGLGKQDIALMIGDGINDAPILSAAHLSVAMGSGTDIAKSAADLILLSNELSHVLSAIEVAKKTTQRIRQNLCWALGYNLVILPLAIGGMVAPYIAVLGMSLSSVIVISNSLRLLKGSWTRR